MDPRAGQAGGEDDRRGKVKSEAERHDSVNTLQAFGGIGRESVREEEADSGNVSLPPSSRGHAPLYYTSIDHRTQFYRQSAEGGTPAEPFSMKE